MYLDGLRGVAIALVVLFHSYSRWPDKLPALRPFSNILFLNTSIAGVQLFFFISGFVILMTLERSAQFSHFLFARWRRLFPAMLVCSLIVFATAGLLPDRPMGQPRLVDLLPGLSLLGDHVWGLLGFALSPPPKSIEAAFWSLYVEVGFYLIFGALFFWRGATSALRWLIGIGVVTSILYVNASLPFAPFTLIAHIDKVLHISHIASILGLRCYTWFGAGALAYRASRSPRDRRSISGAIACLALGAATSLDFPVASSLVAVIAIGAMLLPTVQRVLSVRIFTFLGFISYPLYLNHENMIVALTVRIAAIWPSLPPALLPVLPIILAGIVATLVAIYAEPFVRRVIDALVARLQHGIARGRRAPETTVSAPVKR